MNLYLYISFSSNHPRSVFKGFVLGELRRYVITNSFEKHYISMKNLFYNRLTRSTIHFPSYKLLNWFDSIKYSDRLNMIFKTSSSILQQEENQHYSSDKNASKDASKLIIYKTRYDQIFQKINITGIIRSEIMKTKDSDLKDFLRNITPLLCFTKNNNISKHLVRANVSHYL